MTYQVECKLRAIQLTGQDEVTVDRLIATVRELPEVLECHLMAGDYDFLLRVVASNLEAYRQIQIQHPTRI